MGWVKGAVLDVHADRDVPDRGGGEGAREAGVRRRGELRPDPPLTLSGGGGIISWKITLSWYLLFFTRKKLQVPAAVDYLTLVSAYFRAPFFTPLVYHFFGFTLSNHL